MFKRLVILLFIVVIVISINQVWAQEPKLAAFQETAQVIFDQQLSNNVTASISLQSTSNQDIRIPIELVKKIQENNKVIAIVVTNEKGCVLGVSNDQGCVLVNIHTEGIEGEELDIQEIQEEVKKVGDVFIEDINKAFDIDAKFHSAFLHHRDPTNKVLETSGVISGLGAVSAVYTMPREDAQSMYEKFSAILLPKKIRDGGGFYDVAKKISKNENAAVAVSIIPNINVDLYQLKMSANYPKSANLTNNIDPLSFLGVSKLERSNIFSADFYPLNSLLKTVIISPEPIAVNKISTNMVPTTTRNGEILPDFVRGDNGWFFEKDSGTIIDGTYLFGKKESVNQEELLFSITAINETNGIIEIVQRPPERTEIDSFQIVILVGIIMAAIGATLFYLKGYKSKS